MVKKAEAANEGAKETAAHAAQTTLESADKLRGALQNPANLAKSTKQAAARSSTNAAAKSRELAFGLHGVTQAILAGGLSSQINDIVQTMVNGQTTIYDKAMDAVYNATRVGGGDHRLYDGGHTLWGAVSAVRNASPDDSIFEEARGLVLGLLRDVSTPKGLPVVNWDIETFSALNDRLTDIVPIPKEWLKDMVSYDIADVLGATIAVLAIALKWNDEDIEGFSAVVAGTGLVSVSYGNPVLAIVFTVALAQAAHKAWRTDEWGGLVDGGIHGSVVTGASVVTLSLVSGPWGIPFFAALVVGIVLSKLAGKVSVTEISRVLVRQLRRRLGGTRKHRIYLTPRSRISNLGSPINLRQKSQRLRYYGRRSRERGQQSVRSMRLKPTKSALIQGKDTYAGVIRILRRPVSSLSEGR